MNKLCKVLFLSSLALLLSSPSATFFVKSKRALEVNSGEAKIALLTSKNTYEANEEFVLSMNVIDYIDLQGISVSFNPDSTIFDVVTEGRMTDSYINTDSYTFAKTENGVFDYYSISNESSKSYDYHNNNSLFSIKLKALSAIEDIENIFNFSKDSTMLNFYENIFVIKLSDSKAKEISYSISYGNYDDYSSYLPAKIETNETEIDLDSYIDTEDLIETTLVEVDSSTYKVKTTGQQLVSYYFYDTLTGYQVSYQVPLIVTDIKKPVVSLKGEDNQEILIGTTYTDAGVNVEDDFDNNPTVKVDNTVDTTKLGSYKVNYTITDASGNKSTLSRNVSVIENGTLDALNIHTHANKGNTCEIEICNASSKSIKSFTLQFEVKNISNIKVDNGCTFTSTGNKYLVSGTFTTSIKKGEKLFSFSGSLGSSLANLDQINATLLSNSKNIVKSDNNVIDGNYALSYVPVVVGIYGDVSQDNKVTLMDALLLNDYLNGKGSISDETLKLCDVNLDGLVDQDDVLAIRRYLVHELESLGD